MLEAGLFCLMTLTKSPRFASFAPYFVPATCLLALTGMMLAAGCNRTPTPQLSPEQQARIARQQQAQVLAKKEDADRDEVNLVPPPSKGRYLSVHSADGWANPFLTVHRDTVELRIMFPPTTGSPLDGGSSLLHPTAARKQTVDVRLTDLPDALAAIPGYAWPYGRVVAVEESEAAKRQDRAQVRRTEETTMKVLNDLGIVVDEWNSSSNSLLH